MKFPRTLFIFLACVLGFGLDSRGSVAVDVFLVRQNVLKLIASVNRAVEQSSGYA